MSTLDPRFKFSSSGFPVLQLRSEAELAEVEKAAGIRIAGEVAAAGSNKGASKQGKKGKQGGGGGAGGGKGRKAKKEAAGEKAQKDDKKARKAKIAEEKGFNQQKKKKVVEKFEYVNTTPPGQKKDLSGEMLANYHPQAVEAAWNEWWEAKQFSTPSADAGEAAGPDKRFVMVIPPPNVTGSLHIGHGLTNAIEDTLTRWHRMCGRPTLWLPGTDHAGIATQAVVEKRLMKTENKTRHDLGRDAFVDKVWEWKEQYAKRIRFQLRRLGVSVDWTREAFTMDDQLSRGVAEAFVRMFDSGLIYRSKRLVNWSCQLRTAISDIEVDYIDIEKRTLMTVPGHDKTKKYEFGVLHSFAYKVEGSDEEIVVATTRLETMLGDVAVAVHPDDGRYKHLHGKKLIHPFTDRRLVVVTDAELVDMEFGTGAVKITPAHDPNDFNCGKRHNLEQINVFTESGKINKNGGEFAGIMRYDARWAIEKRLEELGLFRGKTDNKMRLGRCSRSGDIIEPMLKPQWWVDCSDMAAKAVAAVKNKELKIVPEFHEATWFRWLENIRDWCISRQLWWGHRIPAYLVKVAGRDEPDPSDSNSYVVGRTEEEAMKRAVEKTGASPDQITLEQDPDVLDTWFSSGLFPFSTLGWPNEESPDFKAFYPNSLLETGHDILFFWVARMVMMGMQLTGKLPFKTVYLHAMVRDKYGMKMSKSLGNVIDPMEIIEGCELEDLKEKVRSGNLPEKEVKRALKLQEDEYPEGIPECGADALRFGLLAYTVQGRDVNLDINRVVSYRFFCNKLWNATKLALMHLEPAKYKPLPLTALEEYLKAGPLPARERWILHRLNVAVAEANRGLQAYQFSAACNAIHAFWLNDLCDVYLEVSKPVFYKKDEELAAELEGAQRTLHYCFEVGFRMLHPMMPFVTEELWQRLPCRGQDWAPGVKDPESIMVAPYPQPIAVFEDSKVEEGMGVMLSVLREIRSMRAAMNVPSNKQGEYILISDDESLFTALKPYLSGLKFLSRAASLTTQVNGSPPDGCAAAIVNANLSAYVVKKGLVDSEAEREKLTKTLATLEKQIASVEKRLNSPAFVGKAKPEVVQKARDDLERNLAERAKVQEALKQLP